MKCNYLPQILDDEENVVASEHEPVEFVLVVPVDVLPDGAALLPHVVPLFRTFVLDLEPARRQHTHNRVRTKATGRGTWVQTNTSLRLRVPSGDNAGGHPLRQIQ